MTIKKNTILAITVTFCFTASLFMIIPIRSSTRTYDPWLDYDGDGGINLGDLVYLSNSYGSTGDPTRNVNVTNLHDYEIQSGTMNITSGGWSNSIIFCGGRSTLSILCSPTGSSTNVVTPINVYILKIIWSSSNNTNRPTPTSNETVGQNAFNMSIWRDLNTSDTPLSYTTEVKAPYCEVVFTANNTDPLIYPWWISFDYCIYLRNE